MNKVALRLTVSKNARLKREAHTAHQIAKSKKVHPPPDNSYKGPKAYSPQQLLVVPGHYQREKEMRGFAPGISHKRIMRLLRAKGCHVYITGEQYSSQTCNNCKCQNSAVCDHNRSKFTEMLKESQKGKITRDVSIEELHPILQRICEQTHRVTQQQLRKMLQHQDAILARLARDPQCDMPDSDPGQSSRVTRSSGSTSTPVSTTTLDAKSTPATTSTLGVSSAGASSSAGTSSSRPTGSTTGTTTGTTTGSKQVKCPLMPGGVCFLPEDRITSILNPRNAKKRKSDNTGHQDKSGGKKPRCSEETFGLLFCQACKAMWNRDNNGAKNIWDTANTKIHTGERPKIFCF
ncbi:hypothetical protein EDD86DRAFT_209932 [Gorgonomyces haynaldii]|nr:hypothetical protein EDD86DRAFT_209932 [Gorgonomyces haynaldii]